MDGVLAQAKLGLVAILAAVLGFLAAEFLRKPVPVSAPVPVATLPAAAPEMVAWSIAANADGAWIVTPNGGVFFCTKTECNDVIKK